MLLDAEERADALRDEFLSVSIPAEYIAPSAFIRERMVIVQTGTVPPTVHITVDDGYRWQITPVAPSAAGGQDIPHTHDLPRRTAASDVVELVALCVAGQCQRVPMLQVSRVPHPVPAGQASNTNIIEEIRA